MMFRKSIWNLQLALLLQLFLTMAHGSSAREILVVLNQNTVALPGITEQQHEAILDALRGRAQEVLRDQVLVLTSATTLEILRENDIDPSCIDTGCQISLARSLQSRWMLSSNIIHIQEDQYLIQLSFYDTDTGMLLGMEECTAKGWLALKDCACDQSVLLYSQVGGINGSWSRRGSPEGDEWNVDLQTLHVVKFVSQPSGATLYLNGSYVGETPCSRTLPVGPVRIKLSYPRFEDYVVTETISQNQQLQFELIPSFGYLNIYSEPLGAPVVIDGQTVGTTPLLQFLTGFGTHQVLVGSNESHIRELRIVNVARGEIQEEHFVLKARLGVLDIRAHDNRENALVSIVKLNGEEIGQTPLSIELPIGPHLMQVGQREEMIEIREHETLKLDWLVQNYSQSDSQLPVRRAKPSEEMKRRMTVSRRFVIETNLGSFVVELDYQAAPLTCQNFEKYVLEGLYDQSIIHRIVPDLLIQGGGLDVSMNLLKCYDPIKNESANGLKNVRGSLAMARLPGDSDSANRQFFINLKDNPFLDSQGNSSNTKGYCVFGKVVRGMEVVDRIAKVPTGRRVSTYFNVPLEPVVIQRVRMLQ